MEKRDDSSAEVKALRISLPDSVILEDCETVLMIFQDLLVRIDIDTPIANSSYSTLSWALYQSLADMQNRLANLDGSLAVVRAQKVISNVTEMQLMNDCQSIRDAIDLLLILYCRLLESETPCVRDLGYSTISYISTLVRELNARQQQRRLDQTLVETKDAWDAAVETAEHIREAAGIVGTGELAKSFLEYAQKEEKSADALRWMQWF